jgi:hypothetical protein
MKLVLVTRDPEVMSAAVKAFAGNGRLDVFERWPDALDACAGAHMMFVDLLATLDEPHKIAGYEKFAEAKMRHDVAKATPLVMIAPPADYPMDFMTGWPNFLLAQVKRPVTERIFRTAATWV